MRKKNLRLRIGAFLFTTCLLLPSFSFLPADAASKQEKISISCDSFVIQKNTAVKAETNATDPQWQIYDAADKIWVDIAQADEKNLRISRATVTSLLDENNQVKIRVKDHETVSESMTFSLKDSKKPKKKAAKVNVSKSQEAETYNIVINYLFGDGTVAAEPYVATIEKGGDFSDTVKLPIIQGYEPYVGASETPQTTLQLSYKDLQQNQKITVTYKPKEVNYIVQHYWQDTEDTDYTLHETEHKTGYTQDVIADSAKEYNGFYALLYDKPQIAADGSTVVKINYDRYYYLMNFRLNGGKGVDPIYAKYDSKVTIPNPTRAGYTFAGWDKEIPEKMPIGGGTYTAKWEPAKTTYTVVYWMENTNGGYTAVSSRQFDATTESIATSAAHANDSFDGQNANHFTHNAKKDETKTVEGDGSTVVNVYYDRDQLTINYYLYQYGWNSGWTLDQSFTGKYGTTLASNGYTWPKEYQWKSNKGSFGRPSGSRLTFLDAFLFDNLEYADGNTLNLYGTSTSSGTNLQFYKQNLNGSYPDDATNTIVSGSSGTFTFTNKYNGFTISQYSLDGGSTWRTATVNRSASYNRNGLKIRFQRNSYHLSFYNYNKEEKSVQKLYEEGISGENFTPEYPDSFEAGAYTFDGWYTNAEFAGNPVDFDTFTMPASDVTLFAHWIPATYTVTIYNNLPDAEAKKNPISSQKVDYGADAATPDSPELEDYQFVGWFYKNNGKEQPFRFSDVAITKNVDVYAKWTSNLMVPYQVQYQTNTGVDVAASTISSGIAGTTRTFTAKTALYPEYAEGWFPKTRSHSILLDKEKENAYVFVYEKKDRVPYTVQYLDQKTGKKLAEDKVVSDNKKMAVTEKFRPISGYIPDAYQKNLIVGTEGDNVLTFYYTADQQHAYYLTNHYLENADGGKTLYNALDAIGTIGTSVSARPMEISGYTYDPDDKDTKDSGIVTAEGLELQLYYKPKQYPYKIRYLEKNTSRVLKEEKTGTADYNSTITEKAPELDGYMCVSDKEQNLTIGQESGSEATINVLTFYYQINQAAFTYTAVPERGGTVSKSSEHVAAESGIAEGATAIPKNGWYLEGWYKDIDCTIPVTTADGTITKNTFVPKKKNSQYVSADYYAKFAKTNVLPETGRRIAVFGIPFAGMICVGISRRFAKTKKEKS